MHYFCFFFASARRRLSLQVHNVAHYCIIQNDAHYYSHNKMLITAGVSLRFVFFFLLYMLHDVIITCSTRSSPLHTGNYVHCCACIMKLITAHATQCRVLHVLDDAHYCSAIFVVNLEHNAYSTEKVLGKTKKKGNERNERAKENSLPILCR